MRLRHSLIIKVLLLVVAISLMSGFAALAQPARPNPTGAIPCFLKTLPHATPRFLCCGLSKLAPGAQTKTFRLPPCVPPTCGLGYPDTAVMGDMPFDQLAYYAPGKLANNITINAGTYLVTGVANADDDKEYYQIVLACQYLYVPISAMQPSYQAPWSGQPLPTNEVTP